MADQKRPQEITDTGKVVKQHGDVDKGRRGVLKKLGHAAYAAPATMVLLTSDKALAQTPGRIRLVLNIQPKGGVVKKPGMGTFWYDIPAVVKLVAEAEPGWQFKQWISPDGKKGDNAQASPPVEDPFSPKTKTKPLTTDTRLTAVFEQETTTTTTTTTTSTTTTTTTTTTQAPPPPTTTSTTTSTSTSTSTSTTSTSTSTTEPPSEKAPLPPGLN